MTEGDCRSSWRADRGDATGRLDRALVRHFAGWPGLSRRRLQGWIGDGRVRVNGLVVTRPAGRLAAGDGLEVLLPEPRPARRRGPPPAAQPPPAPLAILYEDEHLLALDKPAGLVVHPTGRYRDGTLMNALLWHCRAAEGTAAAGAAGAGAAGDAGAAAAGAGAEPRPGLVSRLDRDTSGVLLVAKSRAAHAGLARSVKARALEKDYLAVVYGRAPLPKGRIELMLRRDPRDRRRVIASRHEGRSAATLYEILAEGGFGSACGPGPGPGLDFGPGPAAGEPAAADAARGGRGVRLSLLRCRLLTGRTHQIRVHLAAVGLPIVGDPVYGEPRHRGIADPALAALCRGFPRQALHARRLALRHPVTRQPLELVAPLPRDLRELLRAAALPAIDDQAASLTPTRSEPRQTP